MNVRIKPGLLEGIVNVPSSKSLTHRAIIAASLADGVSIIKNVAFSKDIDATILAMKSLGAKIDRNNSVLTIKGCYPNLINSTIDANESGSTLRFLIPIAMLQDKKVTFVGHNKLVDRPLDVYFDIFDSMNISYSKDKSHYLPLTINSKLKSGLYKVRGDVSSQFITGLLFALPLLDGDSKIEITTSLESKSYIDLTIDVLKKFGIEIKFDNDIFYIKGNQKYTAREYICEGDFSQAAFWLVADLLGSNVKLTNMNPNSLQGDIEILKDIEKIGGKIIYENNLYSAKKNNFNRVDIDVSNTPDLGPILCVLLNECSGISRLVNARRLRIKESDRITDVRIELNKLGFKIDETIDSMIINGTSLVNSGILDSHNDHRLVMAFAIAATKTSGEVVITNAEAINKSYPNFFKDFEMLGGNISYE